MLYARSLGNEGNSQLDVYSAKMLLVANGVSKSARSKVGAAFLKMTSRKALSFISERRMRQMAFERGGKHEELLRLSTESELDMPDRRALDHAVLELIGIRLRTDRDDWIDRMYGFLRQYFEETRRKEEQAILNKKISSRKAAISPQELADQITMELGAQDPLLFKTYKDFFNESEVGTDWIARELPSEGVPRYHADMHDFGIRFLKGKKQVGFVHLPSEAHAVLAMIAISEQRRETVQLPRAEAACTSLVSTYKPFLRRRDERLRAAVSERVADEDVQDTVFDLLLERVRRGLRIASAPGRGPASHSSAAFSP